MIEFIPLITNYGILALAVLAMVTALWIVSLLLRDSGIVDIFWGVGFTVIAWGAFILAPDSADLVRGILVAVLVSVWGLRLAIHIAIRNFGKPEDPRYQKFRADAGEKWWWYSYLKVFLLQGAIMLIVASPLVFAISSSQTIQVLDYIAIAVWAIGFTFEAGGDLQLMLFKRKAKNSNRVLRTWFWAWTRHPNYFGDAVQWWGYFLLAVGSGLGGFATVVSPLLMTFLLVRISGVKLLEKSLVKTKPRYSEYVQQVSPFFPLPPRRKVRVRRF